ncbi:MAG: MBL fold metallo-hydrolase [candidate division WOR-3 bacterium]
MIRKRKVNHEFGSNCYLIGDKATGEAIIIDPSVPTEEMVEMAEGFSIVGIVLTHAHFDHMLALQEAVGLTSAPIMVGAEDARGVIDPSINLSFLTGRPLKCDGPDILLRSGDIVNCGRWRFSVIETPGHTPGSVSLVCPDARVVITGDTLFADSIGRTDLPGGDEGEMARSLGILMSLGDDFRVLPGHGPEALIWEIKEINPFL